MKQTSLDIFSQKAYLKLNNLKNRIDKQIKILKENKLHKQ